MKKKAFSLAEILITLGLIGIVAALTLPNLARFNQESTTGPLLASVQTTLEEAVGRVILENPRKSLKDDLNLEAELSKHLAMFANSEGGGYVLKNGVVFSFATAAGSVPAGEALKDVKVDINGANSPNTDGVDKFTFTLSSHGLMIPQTCASIIANNGWKVPKGYNFAKCEAGDIEKIKDNPPNTPVIDCKSGVWVNEHCCDFSVDPDCGVVNQDPCTSPNAPVCDSCSTCKNGECISKCGTCEKCVGDGKCERDETIAPECVKEKEDLCKDKTCKECEKCNPTNGDCVPDGSKDGTPLADCKVCQNGAGVSILKECEKCVNGKVEEDVTSEGCVPPCPNELISACEALGGTLDKDCNCVCSEPEEGCPDCQTWNSETCTCESICDDGQECVTFGNKSACDEPCTYPKKRDYWGGCVYEEYYDMDFCSDAQTGDPSWVFEIGSSGQMNTLACGVDHDSRAKGWSGSLAKAQNEIATLLGNQALKDYYKSKLSGLKDAWPADADVSFDTWFNQAYAQSTRAVTNNYKKGGDADEYIITGRGPRGLSSKGHAYWDSTSVLNKMAELMSTAANDYVRDMNTASRESVQDLLYGSEE